MELGWRYGKGGRELFWGSLSGSIAGAAGFQMENTKTDHKDRPQLSGLVFRDGFSLSASSFLFVFSTLCSTEHKLKSPSTGIDPGIHFLPVLFGFARAPAVAAEIPDRLSSQAN